MEHPQRPRYFQIKASGSQRPAICGLLNLSSPRVSGLWAGMRPWGLVNLQVRLQGALCTLVSCPLVWSPGSGLDYGVDSLYGYNKDKDIPDQIKETRLQDCRYGGGVDGLAWVLCGHWPLGFVPDALACLVLEKTS